MRGEKGQALILVIILLAVGAALIVPTLQYAVTGLTALRVSRDLITEQYAADAAVEDALWRLKYNVNGFTDSLTVTTPSQSYSLTVKGIQVPVTVALPADPGAEPPPVQQKGKKLHLALDSSPSWVRFQDTVAYEAIFSNYGTKKLKAKKLTVVLPLGFSYVDGSYGGDLGPADLEKDTEPNGKQKLVWEFTGKKKQREIKPGESKSVTFSATTDVDRGIHYAEATGKASNQKAETGPAGPVWSSIYHITATAGKVTITASAGLTASGDIKVLSWQEE